MTSPEVRAAQTSPSRSKRKQKEALFAGCKKIQFDQRETRFTCPEVTSRGDGLTRFRKTRVSFSFPRSRRKPQEALPPGWPPGDNEKPPLGYNLFFCCRVLLF